jgi:hypothetical protein
MSQKDKPILVPDNTRDKMYGVVNGVYYCNNNRVEDLNNRLFQRNLPSTTLQPQFDLRPVSSKYALMPIYDRRPVAKEQIIKQPNYNIESTFNPGNAMAPWSGFAQQVNDESRLRRQFFALQNCEQPDYVPSTTSDMYVNHVVGDSVTQPFPSLFSNPSFDKFDPNICNIGNKLFDNCTRVQIKNL